MCDKQEKCYNKTMDEKVLKKRVQRMTWFAISVGVVMVLLCFLFVSLISNTLEEATEKNMQSETDEYIQRLNKQIDSDYQLLNTVASLISDSNLEDSPQFDIILEQANEKNDFLSMCYFDREEKATIVTLNQEIRKNVPLSELNPEIQRVVKESYEGKQDISNLFIGDYTNEKVFLYSVPVYRGQEVAGVLAATDHMEIFADILQGQGVMGGTARINLIDQKGNFLVRSNNPVNKEENVDSIFDPSYGGNTTHKEEYSQVLDHNETLYFSFTYKDIPYRMYLAPVGINNWYLCSVNSVQESNAFVYRIVQVLAIFFLIVIVLVSFILFYGYRMISRHNQQLYNLAYHDQLTGAYNFIYFQEQARSRLKEDPNGCIVSMNVWQFKFINEIFGREKADHFLQHMAQMISSSLRKEEFFCRESADFFYLYLKETDFEIIRNRLREMLVKISAFSEVENRNYRIQLSCGAVVSNTQRTVFTFDQMMTHVMFALAKAREVHQNTIWFFDSGLHEKEIMNNMIEGNMHRALEQKEFQLYLQPKMDLKTGHLASAEALVRWVRPDGSIIAPGQFIPLFEKNGFCSNLDLYMFEKVCQQLSSWKSKGICQIPISVNQSKLAFYGPNYIDTLKKFLEKYEVSASLITLEILEGTAIGDVEDFNIRLDQLKHIGFKISMDDFGSGYSSLNTLARLNIDELKIDKDFLKEVSQKKDQKTELIMEEILQLSRRLHLQTVAEGVETRENEELIRKLGCDYGQGYLYSRPIPVDEFTETFLVSKEETV